MTYGYSLPEIATQLDRNIKTIRAHKFNAMTKLGVNSDIGLLSAADILLCLPANNDDGRECCLVAIIGNLQTDVNPVGFCQLCHALRRNSYRAMNGTCCR